MDPAVSLILSAIFGAIGTGYFLYGKREAKASALVCGFGLMIFPWFVDSLWATLLWGAVFLALPFLVSF
jgi:hypothetical protein